MMQLSGNVPCTTLPAPTTTLLPSVVPLRIMLFIPMKQLSPMVIGALRVCVSFRFSRLCSGSSGWKSLSTILQFAPIVAFLPILIELVEYIVVPEMPNPSPISIFPP